MRCCSRGFERCAVARDPPQRRGTQNAVDAVDAIVAGICHGGGTGSESRRGPAAITQELLTDGAHNGVVQAAMTWPAELGLGSALQ